MSDYPWTNLYDYPFPLRPDCLVRLTLPNDLSLTEVRRLQAFLLTLVDLQATAYPDAPGEP